MSKKIDSIVTLFFLLFCAWGTLHGLRYDTFNTDSTYINSFTDRVLPVISSIGCLLISYSVFSKTKAGYLVIRLIGIGLIVPLFINYCLMFPGDVKPFVIELVILVGYTCISLFIWKQQRRA